MSCGHIVGCDTNAGSSWFNKLRAASYLAVLFVGAPTLAFAADAPAQAAVSIPFKSVAPEAAQTAGPWELVCILGIGAIIALMLLVRRRGIKLGSFAHLVPLGSRHIRVLERAPMGSGGQLVVIEYQGRRLLIAIAPGVAQCLRDDAAPPCSPP